jgi:hypothetical protein
MESNRTPIIVLSVVGGVLIAAVIAVLVVFASRIGGEAPLATLGPPVQTGLPVPSPTGTPTPDPQGSAPRFTFFTAQTEVQCAPDGVEPPIELTWETANAVQVWYTAGDADAVDAAYLQVPLNGSQADLTDEHLFPCAQDEYQDYTVTLLGANGEHVSEHFTVTDLNWKSATGEDEAD